MNLLYLFFPEHDELEDLLKNSAGLEEGKLAYHILQHILMKLAVDSKFVLASYPELYLQPDESCGLRGDTSFGMIFCLI